MKNPTAIKRFGHVAEPIARKRLLTAFAPQDSAALAPFQPDAQGRIRFLSRQEALDIGSRWYASETLCCLTKVYECVDGRLVTLRRTATGNSFGADRARNSSAVPN